MHRCRSSFVLVISIVSLMYPTILTSLPYGFLLWIIWSRIESHKIGFRLSSCLIPTKNLIFSVCVLSDLRVVFDGQSFYYFPVKMFVPYLSFTLSKAYVKYYSMDFSTICFDMNIASTADLLWQKSYCSLLIFIY